MKPLSANSSPVFVRSRYRPEIDGLRALAVIPVVLYHSKVEAFTGGYVGVDVFFVISGYLITQILYRDALNDDFSIARFYERRVRRIFPALFCLLFATLVAGLFILTPRELNLLSTSIIATALFVSNIHYFAEAGYFAEAADLQPLLHTWSLGVEEQFYILFPLAVWAIARWRIQWMLPAICAAIGASFALSAIALEKSPTATFYFLPTRAWELLIGSALALLPQWRGRFAGWIAAAGALAIFAAANVYDESTNFPGPAALLPCLGAAAIILAAEGTLTGRVLASAPMRAVGLISYSLYLWHWPILVYARYVYGAELTPQLALFCVGLSLLAAWFSWRFIERPFRSPSARTFSFRPMIAGAKLISLFVILGAVTASGVPSRLPANARALAVSPGMAEFGGEGCFLDRGPNPRAFAEQCLGPPGEQSKTILWGDSHAYQFASAVAGASTSAGTAFRLVARAGCLPLLDVIPVREGKPERVCLNFNTAALEAILADETVDTVVLAGRWSRLGFPLNDPEAHRLNPKAEAYRPAATDDLFESSLRTTIQRLQRSGKKVIVFGSIPEFQQPLPDCLARTTWRKRQDSSCQHKYETLPGSPINLKVRQTVQSISGATMISPSSAICSDNDCRRTIAGTPVSTDRDHLTGAAAAHIVEQVQLADYL